MNADILANVRSVINPLMGVALIVSYLAGIIFIFKAIVKLHHFGQPLTAMRQPGEMSGPLIYFFVGAVLIYAPTTLDITLTTLFGSANSPITQGSIDFQALGKPSESLLGYSSSTVSDQWADVADTLVLYIQFIGFLAFIRGWFIIAKTGARGEQQGAISKGLVHVVAGVLAVNFTGVVTIIKNTIYGT